MAAFGASSDTKPPIGGSPPVLTLQLSRSKVGYGALAAIPIEPTELPQSTQSRRSPPRPADGRVDQKAVIRICPLRSRAHQFHRLGLLIAMAGDFI
jgi:hypothetical protein